MDYLRIENIDDELLLIQSINEEEDSERESRREHPIILKSEGIQSPKRRLTDGKTSEIQPEMPDFSHRFSNTKKSTRLGFKISSPSETEFPLLVRGLESEKNNKEFELLKKKSLNSLDDEKIDLNSLKSDSLNQNFDDVNDEEDILNLKTPSVAVEEISSFLSCGQPSPVDLRKGVNLSILKKLLTENWNYKNKLYLAINDCEVEGVNLNVNLGKSVFFVKEKDDSLIELCLSEVKMVEESWGQTKLKNNELKRHLERLKNENKRMMSEYDSNTGSIKTMLSSLSEEKFSSQMVSKSIDQHLSEEKSKKTELTQQLLSTFENHQRISEQLRELEESWKMNINDLGINLHEICRKREILQEKVKKNQGLVEELKVLASLSVFQKEQIDFCLEMITKTMDFFAESKEHKNFNVKTI